ncbi:MarR family winged helix-turn-helix transcriptional regulator [Clostridium cellulovorans]|uniref:Regulatory protein MarR n=1 Tax=Clostridium cellulovorans (strain ATCC 35296 / DSM 3052 / OCM 3 / 743B) TaxID=573061 RepID=D9SSS1_CLOC7|nr:MarR family transcriptional regulator [Clostridium cellulovorans]ADL52583.1 regulatory protein MarR [Clostridium cellulovorans 743B]
MYEINVSEINANEINVSEIILVGEEMEDIIEVRKLLYKIVALVKQTIIKPKGHMNITATQGMMIHMVGKNNQMKVSELSEALGLSNSTVSGIIDRLEKQNILERIRSEEDRRVVYVKLHPEFKNSACDNFKAQEDFLDNILHKASEEELEKIVETIGILERLLNEAKNKV